MRYFLNFMLLGFEFFSVIHFFARGKIVLQKSCTLAAARTTKQIGSFEEGLSRPEVLV